MCAHIPHWKLGKNALNLNWNYALSDKTQHSTVAASCRPSGHGVANNTQLLAAGLNGLMLSLESAEWALMVLLNAVKCFLCLDKVSADHFFFARLKLTLHKVLLTTRSLVAESNVHFHFIKHCLNFLKYCVANIVKFVVGWLAQISLQVWNFSHYFLLHVAMGLRIEVCTMQSKSHISSYEYNFWQLKFSCSHYRSLLFAFCAMRWRRIIICVEKVCKMKLSRGEIKFEFCTLMRVLRNVDQFVVPKTLLCNDKLLCDLSKKREKCSKVNNIYRPQKTHLAHLGRFKQAS